MLLFVAGLMIVVCSAAAPLSLRERQLAALQVHIDDPWPSTTKEDSTWGESNLVLARLARDRLQRSPNATMAAEISAQVAGWRDDPQFQPWGNYSIDGPLGGLGTLPILFRMALLPLTRLALSPDALATLEGIAFGWLSPRSNASWAHAADSWQHVDGSENLDATRKASLYLSALVVNRTDPNRAVNLDGRPVHEHAKAWERHWGRYFAHRAVQGIGAELGSPTYAKYALQNFINIADLSSSEKLRSLAGDFLTLWFADAAHAFLPSTGTRGGAQNRVYRDGSFFNPHADAFAGFTWLFGWWWDGERKHDEPCSSINVTEQALRTPQTTLFATSSWQPPRVVTAIARDVSTEGFLYTSRRVGDSLPCDQPLGPACLKLPCNPCTVCGGVPAFGGSACELLKEGPTTAVKREYVGPRRLYTLGAIALDAAENYTAGLRQNHKVGAFIGNGMADGVSGPASLIAFGDSGSTDCAAPAFQRHTFGGISSTLVPGALAVVRPLAAKINGCAPDDGKCAASDFPLFAYVDQRLYASRTDAGGWTCFNSGGKDEQGDDESSVFGCLALSGGARLTEAATPCAGPGWNGTLLLFNGSESSWSFGVLQMAVQGNGSFAAFVERMARHSPPAFRSDDGALAYTSLGGEPLLLGAGGGATPGPLAPPQMAKQTYDSPYMSAPYVGDDATTVTISAPGFDALKLRFDATDGEEEDYDAGPMLSKLVHLK